VNTPWNVHRPAETVATGNGSRTTKQGRVPRTLPFDMSGVIRTADGILRYSTLASSLLASLKISVDNHPYREAVVILGGERVTYQQL
jgi:hypothetical protein